MNFRDVYDEHFRFVWRSLRRLGVRESDVSDAAQDVFLVVHRKLAEFEGRSKVTTWLYGICMRVAQDRRKSAYERRKSHDENEPISQRADETFHAGKSAERRQGLAILDALMDEMPVEQRAVFTLFELEQHTSDEIAELCAIPLGTVFSRLRLARQTFEAGLGRLHAKDRFRVAGGTA